jgi:hypothetical protein
MHDGRGAVRTAAAKGRDGPALLALLLLSLVLTYPLVFHLADRVASDLRDPLYNVWVLTWDVHAVTTGARFAEANIFYPHHGTLFYSDALPFLALLGAPVLLLTGNPVLTYNFLLIFSFFLAGTGMYYLIKHLTSSRNAAFLAGLIFAFLPYRFAHIAHLEILFFGWMPLCLLFIHRFFENETLGNLLGIVLFYVLQVTSCAYYGQYLTLFAALMFLYFALKSEAWKRGFFWAKAAMIAFLAAAALFPYLYSYLRVHEKMLFTRALWEVEYYSAQLQHFLAVPRNNFAWGWLMGKLGAQEWQLFPGLIAISLSLFWFFGKRSRARAHRESLATDRGRKIFAVWNIAIAILLGFIVYLGISHGIELRVGIFRISAHRLQKPVILLLVSFFLRLILDARARAAVRNFLGESSLSERFYLFMAGLGWLLCFGPVIRLLGKDILPGPYAILYKWVPGFRNVRVPSRFAALMMLGFCLMSALGALGIIARRRTPIGKNWVAGALATAIIVEYLSVPLPLVSVPVGGKIPEIYGAVSKLPPNAALVEIPMPVRDSEESEEAPAVYYSLYHWRNIVNGYSGYTPPGYRVVREAMQGFPSDDTLNLLADLDVGFVLLHTGEPHAEKGLEILKEFRKYEAAAELVAESHGDYLIRLLPRPERKKIAPRLGEAGNKILWRGRASLNGNQAGLALDGNPATAWSTGYPQRAGEFFELDLGETLEAAEIELHLDRVPLDYPRSFKLESSTDGREWTQLYAKSDFFPALNKDMIEDFSKYSVPIPFERTRMRYLKITLTASHEARHWSISEITIRN